MTYTFVPGDNGIHTFTGTLDTAGLQSITATDVVNSFTGSATGIVVNPAAASQLFVTGFPLSTAGVPGSYTVTLKDPFGNVAAGYRGTMTFTSSDPKATFTTSPYTFTAADAGVHTFTSGATLRTVGTQSITATDAANSLTGAETGIVVNAAAAASVTLSGYPSTEPAGVAQSFTVTLKDTFGNVATGYTGTVSFTSSDPQAVFSPLQYTFTPSDAGTKQFSAALQNLGTQSISVTDISNPGLTASQGNIKVIPGPVAGFVLSGGRRHSPSVVRPSHSR